jgi:hypothetical protein
MIIFNKNIKRFIRTEFVGSRNVRVIEKTESLIPYLSDVLKVDDGVTFGEFFDAIMENWAEYEIVFESFLKGLSLEPFYKEWKSKPKDKQFDDGMKYVEICWYTDEIYEKDTDDDIFIDATFQGWGEWRDKNNKSTGEGRFTLEFSPINELKKYPFKLNEIFEIRKKIKSKPPKKILSFKRSFTVYDVLGAIFHEISFMGSPDMRNEFEDYMNKSNTDIDKEDYTEIKFNETTGQMMIGDQTMKEWLQDSLNKAINKNKSNKDNKPKQSLDDILKKFNIDRPRETNE